MRARAALALVPGTALAVVLLVQAQRARRRLLAERRRADEARARLESLARSSSDAIVMTSPSGSLRAVLQTIALQAQMVTGAAFVALGIGAHPDKPFDPWVFVGMSEAEAQRIGRSPRPVGTLGLVLREGISHRIPDLREHPAFRGFPPGHPVMKSFLGVPIRHGGQTIGHLYLANEDGRAAFTEQDQRAVELLAARASVSMVIARVYENENEAQGRAWLQAVVDQMPEGVVLFDARGRMFAQNCAMLTLAGSAGDEADPFGNPVPYDMRRPSGERIAPVDLPHVRALARGESVLREEAQLCAEDGQRISICVSAVPVRGPRGEVTGATAIFQDITALKEMERLRDEWSGVIAHDLRQPVSVIKLAAGILAQAHEGPMNEQDRRMIARIAASAGRLESMIGDLLDLSCLDAKRLKIERHLVDLSPLVDEIVQRLAGVTAGHDVLVRREGEIPTIWVDPGRLEQVIGNLLSNAAKYGAPGSPIRIDVARRAADVLVTVTNEGRGIPPEELGRLFQRFARSTLSRTSGVPGIGLGLYICRGLVEAHGGRIWAESTPGETTRMRFTLPLAVPEESRTDAPPVAA